METKTIRPIRNNANIRIVVPQYVNLYVYTSYFEVSVTLQVNYYTAQWLNDNLCDYSNNYRCFTFCKRSSKGIDRYYITIVRKYSDLNTIPYATGYAAHDDLCVLKREIRKAKIAQLNEEINNIH